MTWVIAHRGASRVCPENTLAAFDEALHQGCDGIELDLQLSLDGHPMVYHDRTLFRAGGGRKRLHQLKRNELRQLQPGKRVAARFRNQRMSTLSEVLRRYGKKTRLLLELKARGGANAERHRELARATCKEILRKKLESDVMLLCFDPDVLAECRRVAPRIPRVQNVRAHAGLTAPLRTRLKSLAALSVDIRTLTPSFAAAVGKTGTPLLTFTCNTPRRVSLALAAGVCGVMADRPDWLRTRLDAHRLREAGA